MSDTNATHGDFKILVATDNHIGYLEKDPIRGKDSFNVFEEILQQANINKVDFILLGGDLFHLNQPSRTTIYETFRLFRKYCCVEKSTDTDTLDHSSGGNTISNQNAAYAHLKSLGLVDGTERQSQSRSQHKQLEIKIPVYIIHGNHDDPSGERGLSALDLLSVAGFVRYFGKANNIDEIEIHPLELRKGNNRLAIYGLGNIRDDRLHRTFLNKKVKFIKPPVEDTEADSAFNLMVIHQSNVPRGAGGAFSAAKVTNYIPESFLDECLDLVIWGHEHECKIDPHPNTAKKFYVSQPGSSVATSLSLSEAVTKHIGLLHIRGKRFKLTKIPLVNVRPLLIRDINISAYLDSTAGKRKQKNQQEKLVEVVEEMLQEAQQMFTERVSESYSFNDQVGNNSDDRVTNFLGSTPLPLIRLRVEYSDADNAKSSVEIEPFYSHKFGLQFAQKVANPREMIHFHRSKRRHLDRAVDPKSLVDNKNDGPFSRGEEEGNSGPMKLEIGDILKVENMELLIDGEINEAVKMFVEKGDSGAISQFLTKTLKEINLTVKTNIINSYGNRGANGCDDAGVVDFCDETIIKTHLDNFFSQKMKKRRVSLSLLESTSNNSNSNNNNNNNNNNKNEGGNDERQQGSLARFSKSSLKDSSFTPMDLVLDSDCLGSDQEQSSNKGKNKDVGASVGFDSDLNSDSDFGAEKKLTTKGRRTTTKKQTAAATTRSRTTTRGAKSAASKTKGRGKNKKDYSSDEYSSNNEIKNEKVIPSDSDDNDDDDDDDDGINEILSSGSEFDDRPISNKRSTQTKTATQSSRNTRAKSIKQETDRDTGRGRGRGKGKSTISGLEKFAAIVIPESQSVSTRATVASIKKESNLTDFFGSSVKSSTRTRGSTSNTTTRTSANASVNTNLNKKRVEFTDHSDFLEDDDISVMGNDLATSNTTASNSTNSSSYFGYNRRTKGAHGSNFVNLDSDDADKGDGKGGDADDSFANFSIYSLKR